MNNQEQLTLARNLINGKKYNEAEKILLNLLSKSNIKNVQDENATYYTFNNFVEFLTFCYVYGIKKKNIPSDIFYSYIYYKLGLIKFETGDFDKAIEYD